jgi:hypothetical protein
MDRMDQAQWTWPIHAQFHTELRPVLSPETSLYVITPKQVSISVAISNGIDLWLGGLSKRAERILLHQGDSRPQSCPSCRGSARRTPKNNGRCQELVPATTSDFQECAKATDRLSLTGRQCPPSVRQSRLRSLESWPFLSQYLAESGNSPGNHPRRQGSQQPPAPRWISHSRSHRPAN